MTNIAVYLYENPSKIILRKTKSVLFSHALKSEKYSVLFSCLFYSRSFLIVLVCTAFPVLSVQMVNQTSNFTYADICTADFLSTMQPKKSNTSNYYLQLGDEPYLVRFDWYSRCGDGFSTNFLRVQPC